MRKALLLALALVLLSGCLLFPPEEQTKYEIFSNLPSEGAVNAMLADVNGDAFAELISLIGTAMGGKALKNLHGAQLAVFTYEDGGSAAIIKLNTTMELNELMESLPGGYDELVNETKQINGKQVLLLYSSYDTGKENPLCMWREGEWLNFLYYQQGYESSINESLRCDSMMEREYDTKKAEQLLAGSEEMKKKFAGGGKSFGDGMAYIENSSAYVSLFGDENGDYVVAMLQGERTDGNLCYNDSYSGGSAEVVKRGDKEACLKEMKESSSSYIMPMSVSLIYLERRVGDYSLMVVAYAKEKKGAVINEAENIIFGLDFQGQEVEWTDRMNLSVNVYETEEGSLQRIPVADADVKLYKYGYSYTDYEYGGMTTLEAVRSAKTDDNGIAEFRDLEIGSYTVEATREGYAKGTDYVYASDTNSSIRLQKLEPLMVTVTEGAYPRAPVAGAKVKLYNMTESYEYELIKTNYTDSNGTVNFGKIDMTGKVEVSKEGYKNNTATVGAYSTRNITIYLTPVGKGMLKVYADESVAGDPFPNYPPVSEAKIELYNKSGGSYMLVKTLYTNSSGIADFGYVSTEGKIEASKNGYYNSTAIIRADTITYVTTFTVRLVKVAGNASADYPLIQAGGSGCMTPSKDRAPPEWIIGLPDGKGACFWETEPVYGSFGKLINVSGFNLTVAPNEVSVNKTLQLLTSESESCFEEASAGLFGTYRPYAVFTPSMRGYHEYVVSTGTVSARCIAVRDTVEDVNGYYIDSVAVRR